MIFPFVLAVISIVCFIERSKSNNNKIFPDDIQTWCPHTQFCDKQPAKPLPPSTQGEKQPCCRPCSCDPDCGLTRNCCTEEYDIHKLDATLGTVCRSLSAPDTTNYHMVDKCPDKQDTCRIAKNETSEHFFPVYSKMDGRIYVNKNCAACHNQTNTVEFLPSLICPSPNGLTFSSEILSAIDSDTGECFIHYFVPEAIDLSTERCDPVSDRECKEYSSQYTKDMCARFNATFQDYFNKYRNVYCFLCLLDYLPSQEEWSTSNTMCPVLETPRAFGDPAIIVLLDTNSIDNYKASTSQKNKEVCIGGRNASSPKSCRPVYCPFGQVRVGGVCTLIGRLWFVSNLQVIVRLYPTRARLPSIYDILQTTDEQLVAQNTALLHKLGLKDWDVEVYFSVCQNDTVICYLVAVLSLQNKQVKPKRILDKLDRVLRRSWTFHFANVSLNFTPSLNAYSTYHKMKNKTFDNGTWEAFTPIYFYSIDQKGENVIYSLSSSNTFFYDRVYESFKLYITKLFFCEQVDLRLEDFVMDLDEKVFINNSRISLGTNEYQMPWPRDMVSGVRVCLDDFTGEKNGAVMSADYHVFMFIAMVSFFAYIFKTK